MRDRNKRKRFSRGYKPTFKLSKISMIVVALVIAFALGLLYLSQSNQMATSGYDIAKLQRMQKDLKDENERLQLEASRLQSIQQIENGVKDSGMVPIKQINYVPGDTTVAVNLK